MSEDQEGDSTPEVFMSTEEFMRSGKKGKDIPLTSIRLGQEQTKGSRW